MNDEFQGKICYLWIFLQSLMKLKHVFYFLRNFTTGTQRNLLRGSQCLSPPPDWVRCWAVDMCPLYLPERTWENSVWYVLVTKITRYLIRKDVFGMCFPQNACNATSRCKSFEKQQFSIYWFTTKCLDLSSGILHRNTQRIYLMVFIFFPKVKCNGIWRCVYCLSCVVLLHLIVLIS